MSLLQEKSESQWQKLISSTSLDQEVRDYLARCKVKRIMISQAENAWEIYFRCPKEPDAAARESIRSLWEGFFGKENRLVFHFEEEARYKSLADLCRQGWSEIVDKLAQNLPSCRGWLAEAGVIAGENRVVVEIPHEIGRSYLVAHGIKEKLECILKEEYHLPAAVCIIAGSENAGSSEEEGSYCFDDLEDYYRSRFKQTVKKSRNAREGRKKEDKDKVILGKKITGRITPLAEITEEENAAVVQARVFNIERRNLKSGRTLIQFCISDRSDSLACKIIDSAETAGRLLDCLQENGWYLLRGPVRTDRYTQELTMIPADIMETAVETRKDQATEKRTELHLHTKMSALDGLAEVHEVVKRAAQWGHEAIAITDHGVVQAFPEAYEAGLKNGLKIIYGLEGYLFDEVESESMKTKTPTYHCILLAMNQEGLRNLYELVTISHLNYFYRVPRLARRDLVRLRRGLLVGSACEAGELIRAYVGGAGEQELERIAGFYDYLEIQPRRNNFFMLENGTFQSEEEILLMNKAIYRLGKKLGKPVVASGDVHFLDPEDEVYRRILMAGKGFDEADRQAPLYFKTTSEMLEEFAYLGKEEAYEVVIKNPRDIAARVEELKPIPAEFYPPEIPGAEDEIMRLTLAGAREMYGEPLPGIVKKRVDRELAAIINNGFAVLYLIAHKLVKKSNEDGYIVGSRGSVGSSLVATLCGITEVNPLPPHYRCLECKYSSFVEDGSVGSGADLPEMMCPRCGSRLQKDGHNIPFEVFMGFEGDKVPDIDLNFSGEYQPRAHRYAEELFGKNNVFRAGTIATIASKTAYGFVKNYFEEKKQVVRTPEINRLVKGCTGVKRTTGQHPGGLMVLPKGLDVHMFTPLQRPADDVNSETITTHFDYHAISSRLVKLDLLGHDDPTVLKMLEDLTGVDCRSIPLDAPEVLSLFRGTEALGVDPKELGTTMGTLGIPEFGTRFVRQMLEDTKPQTFSDLVRISGFSHGTDVWLNNAQELIKSGTAKMSEVISAREDIMNYLIQKGVRPEKAFKIMEDVRKGKGVQPGYAEIMREHGIPDWYIESCRKIKYLFPKAHAVAYVMMAARIAYFKVHYPAAFYASFFTVRADEFDAELVAGGIPAIKRKMEEITKKGDEATQKEEKLYTILELALEMYLRGIQLKKVDLLKSDWHRFLIVEEKKALLPPFVALQGLGQAAAQGIVNAREAKLFTSREDLRHRAKLSKTVMDVLEQHGCLAGLPQNDQISLFS
ncbi:MAG: PolC-type DNA polymerase III [Peptococcaceae bacterium]|nr:PolC-type DNA polymerase III [Peptococcaceae bacterium]MDH7524080.1 PolC-type DNA polymerase III [Peptococcaceae bacterium]